MEKRDKIFVDGLLFNRPHEKAPDFVKGELSIKVEALTRWLAEHGEGKEWLNADLKISKQGKLYFELDTYNSIKKEVADDINF